MTQIERINPDTLPTTNGAYTHIVRVGDWVYVAGQTAGDMDGSIVGVGDATAQTKQVYRRLEKAMQAVGGSLKDIVLTKTYFTELDAWPLISIARAGVYGPKPPTGTRVAIEGLARPEFILEVEAVGYLGNSNRPGAGPALGQGVGRTMATKVEHLQPDGMTPNQNRYTHVVKVGPWVHIAGQVAADEHGNVVGKGDPKAQVEQVFKNLERAVASVGGKLSDFVRTNAYVVGREHLDAIRAARAGRFGDKPPTSTLLVVSGLAHPDFLLEIEGVAYVEG